LVNLALDPGAGKWGIPDQEGHLAPVDGGARSLVCCHVQRLILARRHYILVHLWIGSLVKCRVEQAWDEMEIKPQFPNGIVSSVSFVSTTNTARSLAGSVSLALALTPWRSPGSSEKLCPAW